MAPVLARLRITHAGRSVFHFSTASYRASTFVENQ